jgi:CRISPR-associated protein Cas6
MSNYIFPIETPGVNLPQDSGYALLSGLCRLVDGLHGRGGVQIAPLRGTRTKAGRILTDPGSKLVIRGITPKDADTICRGWIRVNEAILCLGRGEVEPFTPAPDLVAQRVIFPIDNYMGHLAAAVPTGATFSVGRTSCFHFKGRKFLGQVVSLYGLTPEQSLKVQAEGMGLFRSMGCGVFAPRRHDRRST